MVSNVYQLYFFKWSVNPHGWNPFPLDSHIVKEAGNGLPKGEEYIGSAPDSCVHLRVGGFYKITQYDLIHVKR